MRILLDTHVFLWFISGSPRIPANYRRAIEDPANDVFLSVASIWEAAIKHGAGKLKLPASPGTMLPVARERHGIASLPMEEGAAAHLHTLPAIHRDPFDRMLACQALQHELIVATVDPQLAQYPIQVLPR